MRGIRSLMGFLLPQLVIIGILAPSDGACAINLTQAPAGMRKQNAEISLSWTGGRGRVHLRASTVSGGTAALSHYDSLHLPSQPDAGAYTFRINPDIPESYRNTDLRLGVNYCILSDGFQASREFIVIVESGSAPVLASPANAASLKDLTPTFSWTGDAPYYAVLVSDEPFKISDSGTVTGVSAIWQAITPYTSIRYGDPDPSGINTVPAPPLISGKTYNWLVLNNYGNNSASTSKVAPVPASFAYLPAAPLPASQLLEPKGNDTIPGLDRILFRWTQVEGAVSYKLELLEENLIDGSQADIALWKASSTGGQIALENAAGLLRRYRYKWRVYAIGGNGAASLSEKRGFFYAAQVGDINVTVQNREGGKIAYAPVKLNRLGGASSAVFQSGSTDKDGLLAVKNAPMGTYEVRVENLEGYLSRTDTLVLETATGASRTMILSPVMGRILGKVSATATGTGILNAKVTATGSDGSQWTAVTNSQGNYTLGLPYGNWQVRSQADGYPVSAASTASLSSAVGSRILDFPLAANKFALSGTVRNSFTDQGIFGATVYLTQDGATRSVVTDGNGGFSFSCPVGALRLRASGAGFASPEPQDLVLDGDKSVNISLDPNASILSGRTRDGSGTAISGVAVQATPRAGALRSVFSDNQGFFEMSLPAGDWALTGSAKGYTARSGRKFLLDVSKTIQGVALDFDANRSFIRGRVTLNGSGLSGAAVSAAEGSALTDNSGYYLLSVSAGNQSVKASKEGYLIPDIRVVPVGAGETVSSIDFSATGNAGVVKGRVLAGGAAVAGAEVLAVNLASGESFRQITDAEGRYAHSLPGAGYRISASREGLGLEEPLPLSLSPGGLILDADLRMRSDQGVVGGTVASGNTALGGCEIVYRNAAASLTGKTVTDPQGRYSLSLQAGTAYTLAANCQGYQPSSIPTANLARGAILRQDFNLSPAGAVFRGKVVDTRGTAIPGAKVAAEKAGEAVETLADFSGRFVLSLGSGTYSMSVSKTGYRSAARSLQLSLGENASAPPETLVAAIGAISGRVTSEGVPVGGALASLVGLTPDAGGRSFLSDADGRFGASDLPAGNYSLTVSAEGYGEAKSASLTIVPSRTTEAGIGLVSSRGRISGTVLVDGAPAAGVSVAANAYGVSRSALTGADGSYRLEKLPAGIYSVSASQPGFGADRIHENRSLTADGVLTGLDFALARNAGSLAGTVSGASTAAGIRIALAGKKGGRGYGFCDGSGKFVIPSLPADEYELTVHAPGYKLSGSTQTPALAITGPATFNPVLVPAIFRLLGKLSDQGGRGIAGLPVELRASQRVYKSVSGADGAYGFGDVPAGQDYQLSCRPSTADYDPADTVFSLGLDASAEVKADLNTYSRLANLSGTVFLDGVPVEGAVLRLTGGRNNIALITQPSGAFKALGIAGSGDKLSLSVTRAGAASLDTTLIIGVGEIRSGLALRLRSLKVDVSIAMANSEGGTVKGGLVAAYSGRLDTLAAGADGKFRIEGLPGNQALTLATLLDKSAYDNLEYSVLLKERDTTLEITAVIHASTITVEVRDLDGNPVDGAEVLADGKSLGITVQGKIQARFLGRGTHRFAAGKAAYRSGPDREISISGDTAATLPIILAKIEGGVYGSVRDTGFGTSGAADSPRILPGAVVAAIAGRDTLRDTINSLGQYSIDGLENGTSYRIALTLPGYVPFLDSIVGTAQARVLDVRIRPIPGSVVGRIGNGMAGVGVRLYHSASGVISSVPTRTGGYFAFTGLLHRNDYSVQAFDGASGSQPIPFQADGSAAKRLDLALDRWGGLEGAVTAGAATAPVPVTGALVSLRNVLNGALAWAMTDSLGRYAVSGLAAGNYEGTVERLGYGTRPFAGIGVAKGTVAGGFDFHLEEAASGIAGRVADENGKGLEALVLLTGDGDTWRVRTEGGGQFAFGGQAAGPYRLSAAKVGYVSASPVDLAYDGKGLLTRNLQLVREKNAIHGAIRDALTNAPVAGAVVAASSGGTAVCDSLGLYSLAVPAGSASPIYLDATMEGYLSRSRIPVFLDADGAAGQDISLTADYRFDGRISVSVREGQDRVEGLFLTLQSFHPDDTLRFSLTGPAASSFRDLRRPVLYTLRAKRDGFKDLIKVVALTAGATGLDVDLVYPTSQIRVFVTADGETGKGVEVSLNGESLREKDDTTGLFASASSLQAGNYETAVKDLEAGIVPLGPYFIALGDDSVRTDTLAQPFFGIAIADSILDAPIPVRVRRVDSLRPAPAVECSLYYRAQGDPTWRSLALDSVEGGFAGMLPPLSRAGEYEYYHALRSPAGARIGVVSAGGTAASTAPLHYSGIQSPRRFRLRDPFLLHSIALLPQRLEADTSLYSLGARDLFQVRMRGENGVDLDAYFDERAQDGDTGASVAWAFSDPDKATAFGLSLAAEKNAQRFIRFSGGTRPYDSVFQVDCAVRMGNVRLSKSFLIRIQDLTPASIGIRYVKENRVLEGNGAALHLSNNAEGGYLFSAFATTEDGRMYNISPRWSLGSDSAAGSLSQQGLFLPDSAVARGAALTIRDSLPVSFSGAGAAVYKSFSFQANLATFAQVVPAASGRTQVADGEGTVLDFNLAGLTRSFTVSVKKPKVSGLLRASPREEVVGSILDIELSESQPFKADSGAILNMPIARGVARQRLVYLGHWNSDRLAWERVDSAKGDTAVSGKVYHFSKYGVIMGSLPLGAYDFAVAPNPFTALDPWGLQLGYRVSSDVSSQVGVRIEVYNMMGDKVYESQEQQISKGETIKPGTRKAGAGTAERRAALGPYVWDGRDTRGVLCRNGRYLLKLIVKDGQGSKEYLKKVVMLK